MIAKHDHRALLKGSILDRVDRFDDGELRWERIDCLTLHRQGRFDWHTNTRIQEAGQPAQLHREHLNGNWQVVGAGDGPHYLQLGTDVGDMFSFAICRDGDGVYVLNKKTWTHQKAGALQFAA